MSWFYASTSSFDPDAQNYFDQIVTAGGSIDLTAKTAVNNFVLGCKTDSIWTLMLDVGPLCGADLTAALVKLKKLSSGWSYTNVGFVGGDYSQATGLTASGTKCLHSGVNPSTQLTFGSTGLGVYNRSPTNSNQNTHGIFGGGGALEIHAPYSNNIPYSDQYSSGTQINGPSISPQAAGFIFGTRTSGPEHSLYRNGTQVATSGSVSGSLPNLEISFFARREDGGDNLFTNHTNAFLIITAGMNSTQAAALNTRVQALQTALGRNV